MHCVAIYINYSSKLHGPRANIDVTWIWVNILRRWNLHVCLLRLGLHLSNYGGFRRKVASAGPGSYHGGCKAFPYQTERAKLRCAPPTGGPVLLDPLRTLIVFAYGYVAL